MMWTLRKAKSKGSTAPSGAVLFRRPKKDNWCWAWGDPPLCAIELLIRQRSAGFNVVG